MREEVNKLAAIRAAIDGVDYLTTKEAMGKEREVLRKALDGGILLKRVKRGQPYQSKEGETVLTNPTFEALHAQSQSAEPFTALYQYRHYAAKGERGNPNHWLEDLGFLNTEQVRPERKLVEKAIRVSGQVQAKILRQIERIKRFAYQELNHERAQVAAEHGRAR